MPIKEAVKIVMFKCDVSLTQLVHLLNEKYDCQDTIQNLEKKINKGTLKYREAEEIAEVLGYEIQWVKNRRLMC
ncbi:hypothetical protein SDC9_120222 [bioreactor metagenome]|uniref:Phosphoribosylglycinamide formyltransferase n=1 Tax=bioreactor metagenome TaxID=1076179 RepID=A0A645C631_9ZZZZ